MFELLSSFFLKQSRVSHCNLWYKMHPNSIDDACLPGEFKGKWCDLIGWIFTSGPTNKMMLKIAFSRIKSLDNIYIYIYLFHDFVSQLRVSWWYRHYLQKYNHPNQKHVLTFIPSGWWTKNLFLGAQLCHAQPRRRHPETLQGWPEVELGGLCCNKWWPEGYRPKKLGENHKWT